MVFQKHNSKWIKFPNVLIFKLLTADWFVYYNNSFAVQGFGLEQTGEKNHILFFENDNTFVYLYQLLQHETKTEVHRN